MCNRMLGVGLGLTLWLASLADAGGLLPFRPRPKPLPEKVPAKPEVPKAVPPQEMTQPHVIEGETLPGAAKATEGQLAAQSMAAFGNAWSGGSQLLWTATKPGAAMSFPLKLWITSDTPCFVEVAYTKAPDYGKVQLTLNGVALGQAFDAFAPQVAHGGSMVLGIAKVLKELAWNQFQFTVVGKNPSSKGHYIGIDAIRLVPVPPLKLKFKPVGSLQPVIRQPFRAIKPYSVKFKASVQPIPLSWPGKDLRPDIQQLGLTVRNQENRPTCSVFAVTFLHEFTYHTVMNLTFDNLSEEYLNRVTNMVTNSSGDGDFFSNLNNGYQTWGVCFENLVPYTPSSFNPNLAIPQQYLDWGKAWPKLRADFIKTWDPTKGASQAQLDRAVAYLDRNIPVAGGFLWPTHQGWQTQTVLGVEMMVPPAKDKVVDGHSVALVGYKKSPLFPGGGYFIFRNSWGGDWGDQGYGYMAFSYVLAYANDLLAYY